MDALKGFMWVDNLIGQFNGSIQQGNLIGQTPTPTPELTIVQKLTNIQELTNAQELTNVYSLKI